MIASQNGGPSAPRYFTPEFVPRLKHRTRGTVSMAVAPVAGNEHQGGCGSQFFITLAPTPWLDGKHTIFGRVKSGLRVVQRMGLVKTGKEDRPAEEVKIVRAWVVEKGDDI